ncbi:MAG: hypothetical protein AAFR64_09480 [Pseudomonadota bacterium]
MFEKNQPFIDAVRASESDHDLLIGSLDSAPDGEVDTVRAGDALRAIEWSELTARLSAARELRRELRNEAMLCAGSSGARFGDAAAGFFNALSDGERAVNLEDLEGCKASCGTPPEIPGVAAKGDARDDL